MNYLSTAKGVVTGIATAIVMIASMTLLQYVTFRNFWSGNQRAIESDQALIEISNVKSELEQAQTNARYFLFLGSPVFSGLYDSNRVRALDHLERLRKLTAGDASQQARTKQLQKLASDQFEILTHVIQGKHQGNSNQVFAQTIPELAEIDLRINRVTRPMQEEECRLLRQWRAQSNGAKSLNVFVLTVGGGLSVLLLSGAAAVIRRCFRTSQEMNRLLQEKEEFFRSMLWGVKDYAIVLLDPEGLVMAWNAGAERIYGYEEGEIIGRGFAVFYTPEDAQAGLPQTLLEEALEAGEHEEEGWRLRKNASLFWANVVITAIFNEARKLKGFVLITRDLTPNREAEGVLARQAQELQDQADLLELTQEAVIVRRVDGTILFWNRSAELLYGWCLSEAIGRRAHELLATAYPASLEAIERELTETTHWQGHLVHRTKNGEHVTIASRWTLQFAKGGLEPRVLEINSDITAHKLGEAELRKSEEQIRLVLNSTAESIYSVDLQGRCTFCNFACVRMLGYTNPEELLGKSMHTACHHTRADRTELPFTESPIFRAIQDGENTHVESALISRKDATSFPAECWTSAIWQGSKIAGAVVTFIDIAGRKRADEEASWTVETITEQLGHPASRIPKQGARILIAEDSPDSLYLLHAYLRGTPYIFDAVQTGTQALARATSAAYELIFINVEMPEMDGYSVTRAIRNWEAERGVKARPIVALTSHSLASEAVRSLEAGCTDYLSKPVTRAAFLDCIRKNLAEGTVPEDISKPKRIRVKAPEGLEELSSEYLEQRLADLTRLAKALESQDFETLRMAGHNLKGTGSAYGFPEITQSGAHLEAAAKSKNAAEIRRHLNVLAQYINNVDLEEAM